MESEKIRVQEDLIESKREAFVHGDQERIRQLEAVNLM